MTQAVVFLFVIAATVLETGCQSPKSVVSPGEIIRLDPSVDNIIPADAHIRKLAGGFTVLEGPLWRNGYLLFTDLAESCIYQWMPDGQILTLEIAGRPIRPAPLEGPLRANGLTVDGEGRLTVAGMGSRTVWRLEKNGALTILADRYEGKRLNSPNDLVYRFDGTLYFTDPPYGLPSEKKELAHSGVFSLRDGKLQLIRTDLRGPNGLAFSPDEEYLYVTSSEADEPVMRYEANADGTLTDGEVFFDARHEKESWDGMKVDRQGNLYVTGAQGVRIISATRKHIGTIKVPEYPTNVAFGGEDGKTLFITAGRGLYQIRLNIEGIRP